jgi:hypothetical protein
MTEDGNSAGGAADAARKLAEPAPRTFSEFLESVSPAQLVKVTNLWGLGRAPGSAPFKQLMVPDIQLHCTSNDCNGLRFYRFEGGERNLYRAENSLDTFISYRCSNCQSSQKVFSLHAVLSQQFSIGGDDRAAKLQGQAAVEIEPKCTRIPLHPLGSPSPPPAIPDKLLIAISESRQVLRKSARHPANAGLRFIRIVTQ